MVDYGDFGGFKLGFMLIIISFIPLAMGVKERALGALEAW